MLSKRNPPSLLIDHDGIIGDFTHKFERIVNKNNIHVMYKDHIMLTKMLNKKLQKDLFMLTQVNFLLTIVVSK